MITVHRIAVALDMPAFFLCWLVEVDDPCSIAWELSPPVLQADNEILVEFGERIRDIRLRLGLSMSEAHKAGALTPSHLSDVERGRAIASLRSLVRLAGAYGVTVWFLLPRPEECDHALVVIESARLASRSG